MIPSLNCFLILLNIKALQKFHLRLKALITHSLLYALNFVRTDAYRKKKNQNYFLYITKKKNQKKKAKYN